MPILGPTVYAESSVQIAEYATIGPYCKIAADVVRGHGCRLVAKTYVTMNICNVDGDDVLEIVVRGLTTLPPQGLMAHVGTEPHAR